MISAMFRALIVWTFCILLVVLGVTGAHGHRTIGHEVGGTAHEATHAHPETHEPPSLFSSTDSSSHEHEHAYHGAVDVDPPAKVFSKASLLLKVDLVLLFWVGALVLVLRLAAHRTLAKPPQRPPKCRWHPFQLPPSQAPPCTA